VGISREAAAIAGAVVRSPATPVDRLEFNRLSGKSRLINPEVSCVPMVPGWRLPGGGIGNGPEYAVPHAIIVDRAGRRFCNDSYWVDLVPRASTPLTRICRSSSSSTSSTTASADWVTRHPAATTPTGWSPPPPRCASWRRARHRRRAAGGHGGKLQRAPHEARIPGSDGAQSSSSTASPVTRTIRSSPVLGPLSEPPFHGLRLVLLGTAIGSSGVQIDGDCHVLDQTGASIPGLYAVGRAGDDVRERVQQRGGPQPRP